MTEAYEVDAAGIPEWRHAFDAALAREHARGDVSGITPYVSASSISFPSQEHDASMAARVVRRADQPAPGPEVDESTFARLRARYREGP